VRLNTVIKDDNIDDVMPIVRHAASVGAGVNLSVYTDFKNGNAAHLIRGGQLARIEALTAELLAYKRAHRGVLSNSDWYIAQIPRYLRGEMREPCRAGETTIHIDPSGHVRRCPDFPVEHHWSKHTRYEPISCNKCYYACRGEAQAPLTISRFRDLAGKG
jgi:MoaA/NifB/PqqE/SkfB family radical SAM enzyme